MTVFNRKSATLAQQRAGVDIMRPSVFGNPFRIGDRSTRDEVLSRFRVYLWRRINSDSDFRGRVAALHGRDLICCCKPEPCHGDILEAAAAWLNERML